MSITQEETENLRQREIAGELWEISGQSFQVASLLPGQGTECPLCGRAANSVLELRPRGQPSLDSESRIFCL